MKNICSTKSEIDPIDEGTTSKGKDRLPVFHHFKGPLLLVFPGCNILVGCFNLKNMAQVKMAAHLPQKNRDEIQRKKIAKPAAGVTRRLQ